MVKQTDAISVLMHHSSRVETLTTDTLSNNQIRQLQMVIKGCEGHKQGLVPERSWRGKGGCAH